MVSKANETGSAIPNGVSPRGHEQEPHYRLRRICDELARRGSVDKVAFFVEQAGLLEGIDTVRSLRMLSKHAAELRFQWITMSLERYATVLASDPRRARRIYWQELLERAHSAVLLSAMRASRWMDGLLYAVQQENHLAFAACYRGLLESIVDSSDALTIASARLREKKSLIRACILELPRRLDDKGDFDKELEDKLIHFSHARDLGKEERKCVSREAHEKKQFWEYRSNLERSLSDRVFEAWRDLCQLTHPSAHSVLCLMAYDTQAGSGDAVATIGVETDYLSMLAFESRHPRVLKEAAQTLVAQLATCQAALDDLPYKKVHGFSVGVVEGATLVAPSADTADQNGAPDKFEI